MKNRLYRLVFSLLIAVMCANCALPALAAAEMSEGEKKYFEDSVAASKKTFLQLYEVLWREHKLDDIFHDADFNDIEKNINEKTVKQYEEFLRDLEKRFCDENNREIATFYENLSLEAIAKSEEPQVKDHIRESTKEILEGNAKDLCEQVVRSLRKKHRGSYIRTGTTEIDLASPELSRQTISSILQSFTQEIIQNSKMEEQKIEELKEYFKVENFIEDIYKLPEAELSLSGLVFISMKKLLLFFALANPGSFSIQTYDASTLSEGLITQHSKYFWEAMESDVRAIFEEAYAVFRHNLEDAED